MGEYTEWKITGARRATRFPRPNGTRFIRPFSTAGMFEEERRDAYAALKLEGILESPLNICVTCDRERAGPVLNGASDYRSTN